MERRLRWLGVFSVLLIALVMVGTYIWINQQKASIPPTDAELRQRFAEHRKTFDTLKSMAVTEDVLHGIGDDFLSFHVPGLPGDKLSYWLHAETYKDPDGNIRNREELLEQFGIPRERGWEYLRLLKSVDAYRMTWSIPEPELGPVSIHVFRYGIVPSGVSKAIVFYPPERFPEGPPAYRTTEDTDTIGAKGEWLAPLEDGWYILKEIW